MAYQFYFYEFPISFWENQLLDEIVSLYLKRSEYLAALQFRILQYFFPPTHNPYSHFKSVVKRSRIWQLKFRPEWRFLVLNGKNTKLPDEHDLKHVLKLFCLHGSKLELLLVKVGCLLQNWT